MGAQPSRADGESMPACLRAHERHFAHHAVNHLTQFALGLEHLSTTSRSREQTLQRTAAHSTVDARRGRAMQLRQPAHCPVDCSTPLRMQACVLRADRGICHPPESYHSLRWAQCCGRAAAAKQSYQRTSHHTVGRYSAAPGNEQTEVGLDRLPYPTHQVHRPWELVHLSK